ncbi:hypothetical protein AMTRI_Chr12g274470 [Amborella trichopoda]
MGGPGNWFLLERLRRAIQKVKFLLSLDVNKLRIRAARALSRRQLSLKEPAGLIECTDVEGGLSPGAGMSPGAPDIDQKADEYIANFYRRMQLERQISLDLRYCDRLVRASSS